MVWHMILPLATLMLEMSVFYALIIHSDLFRFRPFDKRSFTPFFALFLALSWGALLNVETIHSWPGIGLTMLSAILSKDLPLAVGAFVYIVIVLIFINMAMAISRGLRDLRERPSAIQQAESVELEAEPSRRARWPLWIAAALFFAFVGMMIAHPILMGIVWEPSVYDPVTGYDPPTDEQLAQGLSHPLAPSAKHLLGTDPWGRDLFSQLLYSTRSAFMIGGLAGLIATSLGLGAALLIRALERGRAKSIGNGILALGCALLALPSVPLLLLISVSANLNLYALALRIGFFAWPLVLFIIRSRPELLRPADGTGLLKTLAAAFLYVMALAAGIEAVLSFYGLLYIQMGWGLMVEMANISGYLVGSAVTHYWWLFWPATLAIILFGFSAYLLGWELKARAQEPRPVS